MLKQLYRALVPQSMHKVVARREVYPRRILHRLRWHLADARYISEWTERRLQLRDNYWLFVLGLNNSGTTMLAGVLAAHPHIRPLPDEGQRLTFALPRPGDHGVVRKWSIRPDIFRWTEESDPSPAQRVRYDWAFYVEPRPGIIMEKSPQHSARARWLQKHFQPSRFLIIVRNPYAVCEGICRRSGGTMEDAATHWIRGHQYLLEDIPYLERSMLITYEAFCDDTDRQLGRIQDFLELAQPFDRTVLHKPIRAPNMDGTPKLLQNYNARSMARLSPDDVVTIGRIAAPLMKQFGYVPLQPRRRSGTP